MSSARSGVTTPSPTLPINMTQDHTILNTVMRVLSFDTTRILQHLYSKRSNRYTYLIHSHIRIIIAAVPHRHFPNKSFVVADSGIVYYVYAPNHCTQKLRYLEEILSTTKFVKDLNYNVFILSSIYH